MNAYGYRALDAGGRTRKGAIEADTPRAARSLLRERGLIALELHPLSSSGEERGGRPARGLAPTELALMTRQLATLIDSGLPVEQALAAVAAGLGQGRVAGLVLAVRAGITEGRSLADALGDFPRAFPDLYVATVAAGERSGLLAPVFERLAEYTEARQQLRQKIALALFYPLLLGCVATGVVLVLLTWVVPQVTGVFASLHQELPPLTRGLIAVADFLRARGWMLGAVLLAGLIGLLRLRRIGAVREWLDAQYLRLPLFGRLQRALDAARCMRTFSILITSGVSMLEALRIAAQVVSSVPIRHSLLLAAVRVREGASLSSALRDSGQFPAMTVQLLASGEASGRLGVMAERAACQQEREAEMRLAALLALFEPVLILTLGGIVLLIVLAILLPIFDLNQLVH